MYKPMGLKKTMWDGGLAEEEDVWINQWGTECVMQGMSSDIFLSFQKKNIVEKDIDNMWGKWRKEH